VGNIPILLLDINEQEEIVSYLDRKKSEIDQLIFKKEKAVEELNSYKKSLIYEYVTGKKEVPA
jgi:type I restriction enzyme S subunit